MNTWKLIGWCLLSLLVGFYIGFTVFPKQVVQETQEYSFDNGVEFGYANCVEDVKNADITITDEVIELTVSSSSNQDSIFKITYDNPNFYINQDTIE